MRKFLTAILLLAAIFATAGCEKIDATPDGMVEIFAESMSGSKVVLDGVNATWKSGDEIRINDATATVERRDGHAYISNAALQSTNRALYPASLGVANWGTDSPTITLPAYYHYRTDGNGHQVLDLPMAAYSTSSSNPLQFKHLTGALYITVTNIHDAPLKLLSVSVSSNTYQVSGSREINISSLTINPMETTMGTDRTVTMFFDTTYTLAAGSSVKVMLPILPVAADNRFTIKVKSYVDGQSTAYLYSNTQPSGGDHSLERNQLGYAPVEISASGSASLLEQESGNYVVRTPMEFVWLTNGFTNGTIANNATIDILDDFDMSGYPISPIDRAAFSGTVDGHGHTINNLTVNSIRQSNGIFLCGMFGRVSSMTIKNLNINNMALNHTGNANRYLSIGGLVASSDASTSNTLTIENCNVNISEINIRATDGYIYFGGLAGMVKYVSISNCEVSNQSPLVLNGAYVYFGGLVGKEEDPVPTTIESSSWIGSVTLTSSSNTNFGGLIGRKAGGNLTLNSCSVDADQNVITTNGNYNYYGSMIGYYNKGTSVVDTSGNKLSVGVTANGTPVELNHFGN